MRRVRNGLGLVLSVFSAAHFRLPPWPLAYGQNSSDQPAASAKPPAPEYLVRVMHEDFDSGVRTTCTALFPDGTYLVEHSSQPWSGREQLRAYQGNVSGSQLQELQRLLDEPHLKAIDMGYLPDDLFKRLRHVAKHDKQFVRSLTFVWIRRGEKTQSLGVTDEVAPELAGSGLIPLDKNAKYVRPLEKWVKQLPTGQESLVDPPVSPCLAQ
jgi:hypothetical protein